MVDDPDAVDNEFDPGLLLSVIIAPPLSGLIAEEEGSPDAERTRRRHPQLRQVTSPYQVIIDLNVEALGGTEAAKNKVRRLLTDVLKLGEQINENKTKLSDQHVFARLPAGAIHELVRLDLTTPITRDDLQSTSAATDDQFATGLLRTSGRSKHHAIYHVWLDFPLRPQISRSATTVKADAAHRAFSAFGEGIVWAVIDSGIDKQHPHFREHDNLNVDLPLKHRDFTVATGEGDPLHDGFGHGTHVAGIIAGAAIAGPATTDANGQPKRGVAIRTQSAYRDESNNIRQRIDTLDTIAGVAPRCKLLSLKVLDDQGNGEVSNLIAATAYIQQINGYGRKLLVHGVNMSLGYDFDPEWFACGQSPLCVEVNRLVRSGVIVVVAAGNTGYVYEKTLARSVVAAGASLTINDPGNADLAITVGSTHRDMPHVYGVSYFSSKGPTGDGRLKPDLVAPGEKILSCGTSAKPAPQDPNPAGADCDTAWYVQDSGTSMAAPHVSGAIAAFLSIRQEFIGETEQVKSVFVDSATDLKRERYFQGGGLLDLMRAIQAV